MLGPYGPQNFSFRPMEGLMKRSIVTEKDGLIWQLLRDPGFEVTADGRVLRHGVEAGCVYSSRNGTKLYRRLRYKGERLYVHRIIWAALRGFLCSTKTINHKDLNGLNNRPANLELVSASQNIKHAKAYYRRRGMSAAEARANWNAATKIGNWGKHAASNTYGKT